MGGESVLGPVPGFIVLGVILLGALFYYLTKPEFHPTLGEKIVKGDARFEQYQDQGHPVRIARYRIDQADTDAAEDEAPSTRTLFLYFKAKGYPPADSTGDSYQYIALPPTGRDWVVEFVLWLLIPMIAVLYTVGARIFKITVIAIFLYIVLGLAFVLFYLPLSYLFGTTVGIIFGLIGLGVAVTLVGTRYRNTRLVQWVF